MGFIRCAFRWTSLSVSIFFSHEIFFFALLSASRAEPSSELGCSKKKEEKEEEEKKENPLVIDLPMSYGVAAWLLVQVAPGAGPCMIWSWEGSSVVHLTCVLRSSQGQTPAVSPKACPCLGK